MSSVVGVRSAVGCRVDLQLRCDAVVMCRSARSEVQCGSVTISEGAAEESWKRSGH